MDNIQFETGQDPVTPRGSGPRVVPTVSEPIRLPGYGLPLNYLPPQKDRFPYLIGDRDNDFKARTLLVREVCMLKFMEDITNKPEWWRKIRDPAISSKWKTEVLRLNWSEYRKHGDFTKNMAERCIEELRLKATLYEETGLLPVMDHAVCVIKSDKLFDNALTDQLKAAVKPLEDVPEAERDWHPRSDKKVLDLVHPSLFPLTYGRSRILNHQRITLQESLNFCGRGFLIPTPSETEAQFNGSGGYFGSDVNLISTRFQWLPCDVLIGQDGKATIESYINNAHPEKNSELYPVVERFIEKSLPAFDLMYRWVREFPLQRIATVRRIGKYIPVPDVSLPASSSDDAATKAERSDTADDGSESRDDLGAEDALVEVVNEEAEEDRKKYCEDDPENHYDAEDCGQSPGRLSDNGFADYGIGDISSHFNVTPENVKSSGYFNGASRLQVIVKLANIHLTPEKPSYDGGSWHVEGQLNEHICATALFYYDNENITESRLAFRSPANREELAEELEYQQNDDYHVERVFALCSGASTLQDVGSVLTRPNRAIFFPNLLQHRVQPFRLQDPTKPGHRKILALFLVDPAVPVISTANVPPQQRHWYANEGQSEAAATALRNIGSVMDMDEAKRLREELMSERTVLQQTTDTELENMEWSFCEH